mmetsp:Transcript_50892/g.110583  ORF Transcript_50892/g.110583 Transcript_50892/m.110583 type:complete len:85 (+) Transcript_50892:227-481(+)|eukprot:CAMPEP_0175936584 /NCGR_PEP_ID=MMETSP0108-20121206/21684_1 /TAXON_ID=195067 ORGANISM="Goniomonas pacifica, Strain CCMP1869" /NCGR_SAMPLE_ID=MMETSP0108 /ASSEMBLY_ACC=CAM_ASM_000204 /LENGTH=84 /DNA_ID=CAMNT_0017260665 /DNA_START=308 /DNA_END=562 /DNA_ORIENTATION=-
MPGLDFGPQKTESCDFSPYQEPEPDTLDNNWDVPETGTGPTHDENRVVPAKQSKARFRGKKQHRLVKAATRKRTQMMFYADPGP